MTSNAPKQIQKLVCERPLLPRDLISPVPPQWIESTITSPGALTRALARHSEVAAALERIGSSTLPGLVFVAAHCPRDAAVFRRSGKDQQPRFANLVRFGSNASVTFLPVPAVLKSASRSVASVSIRPEVPQSRR